MPEKELAGSMANKPTKSSPKEKKSTIRRGRDGKTARPAAGKTHAKGASRQAARTRSAAKGVSRAAGKSASKRSTKGASRSLPPTATQRVQSGTGASRPVLGGLSLDRKLDMIGVVMALLGLLTLLSLLSASNSSLTGTWVRGLALAFGLGRLIFPFALIVAGLWLILRNFEQIPQLSIERISGSIMLFLDLLVGVQLARYFYGYTDPFAGASLGGGYVGAFLLQLLLSAFGIGGAVVAIAAWTLIALALTLDVTVLELFGWVAPLLAVFKEGILAIVNLIPRRKTTPPASLPFPGSEQVQAASPVTSTSASGSAGDTELYPGLATEPRLWVLPPIADILDAGKEAAYDDEIDRQRARIIEETLESFGAPARVVEINRGPTITQFGVEPDFIEGRNGRMRVRVGKIAALADDLALALSARTIRIQAPVPGKGFVGIEAPNDEISVVALRDVIESEAYTRMPSPLRFALGQNVAGMAVAADLAAMPHLLIAGATGSGKSVCVNALISCLLINNTPDDMRMIMVDPKRVELTGYNGIPHLLAPVVVEMEKVVAALQWVTREMDMRYRKLADAGTRNIQDYNRKAPAHGLNKMPYLVVIIDELADLMMLAPDETEKAVTRLAQLARATGIHLVIATQRPSVDVVTGLIKANFPARIAFAVASGVDSRVILDQPGAERLLGRGDMLFQAPDSPAPVRLQGVFVSDAEIQRLVLYWQGFSSTTATTQVAVGGPVDALPENVPLTQLPMWEGDTEDPDADPLLKESIDLVRRHGRASISMLQRRLRIGYTRAARMVETMEEKGIVSKPDPVTGTRAVVDYGPAAPPADEE